MRKACVYELMNDCKGFKYDAVLNGNQCRSFLTGVIWKILAK